MLVAEGDHLRGLHPVNKRPSCRDTGAAEPHELLPLDLEFPVVPVLGDPGVRQQLKCLDIIHPHRRALDHDIPAAIPPVGTRASGGHRHLRVGVEVAVLLLLRAGAKANAPACQTPTRGTACGRPSTRTVTIQ